MNSLALCVTLNLAHTDNSRTRNALSKWPCAEIGGYGPNEGRTLSTCEHF